MKLTSLTSGDPCKDGDCPCAYKTDRGTAVIQGWKVTDAEALSQLRLPATEGAVEIPVELIRSAARALGLL